MTAGVAIRSAARLTAASAALILQVAFGRGFGKFGGTTQDHIPFRRGEQRRLSTLAGWAAVLLVSALAIGTAGCAGIDSASGDFTPVHRGVLTVVTQPLPTAGFWDGTDAHPTGGLEYGIARALAHRFGLRLVVRTEPFARIVAGHLDGADLALSLITPTSAREQALDFSAPYIDAPPALLVRTGASVPDLASAQALRWAVESDTTLESTIADVIQPDQPPLQFAGREGVLRALNSGPAEATLFDLPAAIAIAHTDPKLTVAAHLANTEPIAAALPSGSHNVEAVSSAMRGLQADGTIDRLAKRWLGVSITDSEADIPLLRTTES